MTEETGSGCLESYKKSGISMNALGAAILALSETVENGSFLDIALKGGGSLLLILGIPANLLYARDYFKGRNSKTKQNNS